MEYPGPQMPDVACSNTVSGALRKMLLTRKVLVSHVLMLWMAGPLATEYYIAPNGDDDNPGTESSPWRSIAKANATLKAGDTVFIKGGDYQDPIKPSHSGEPGKFITYHAYPGRTPVLTNSSGRTAIVLKDRSYIKVDGFKVDGKAPFRSSNLRSWAKIVNGHHNIIQNSDFKFARGWAGIHLGQGSQYNKILNNRMDHVGTWSDRTGTGQQDRGDTLVIKCNANHNLFEGNHLTHGGHNLYDVDGRFNVFRNNIFDNDWSDLEGKDKGQRNGQFDGKTRCTEIGGFNLVEGNIFRNAKKPSDARYAAATKVQGSQQIVRKNFFYNNHWAAIRTGIRPGKVEQAQRGKIYHNVFFDNGLLWAVQDKKNTGFVKDNMFKNNIIAGSRLTEVEMAKPGSNRVRKNHDPMNGNSFIANSFRPKSGSSKFMTAAGKMDLASLQQSFPRNAYNNLEIAPQFVVNNPRNPDDFRLKSNSPLIDKGDFLTSATSSGSGKIIPVKDAGYFTDGFGMVEGDYIQVGSNAPVRVTNVDYDTNRIRVEQSISWSDGDAVSLPYNGAAPDIGAHESWTAASVLSR